MGDERHLLSNDEGGEWEFPSGRELGALLRAKREDMGLTYAQISEQIRVSSRYLEALENEDWDSLPSPTFIKGFIRSYARVLGFSEEGLIALYQETAPPSQPMAKPLPALPKKKRAGLYLVLVFAVLAAGVAVYHWIEHSTFRGKPAEKGSALPADERLDVTPADPEALSEKEKAPSNEAQQSPGPLETARDLSQKGQPTAPRSEGTGSIDKPAEATPRGEDPASPSEKAALSEAGKPAPDMAPAAESDTPPLVLNASVKERTWVRVTIDGERPKEYIFDAGSSPEWRAHKGFELLIGNAGGIDLNFNGKKFGDLGKRGQVIRLRLPPPEDERGASTN
jgi:cytoskeleton protein RodZ